MANTSNGISQVPGGATENAEENQVTLPQAKAEVLRLEGVLQDVARKAAEERRRLLLDTQECRLALQQCREEAQRYQYEAGQILQKANEALAAQETMRQSTSWRITKPLRAIMNMLRGGGATPPAHEMLPKAAPEAEPIAVTETQAAVPDALPLMDLLAVDTPYMQAFDIFTAGVEGARVNVVSDAITEDGLFGSEADALVLATSYANLHSVPLRVITRSAGCEPELYARAMQLHGVKPAASTSFYSDADRNDGRLVPERLEVHDGDLFIAVGWWAAYALRQTFPEAMFCCVVEDMQEVCCSGKGSRVLFDSLLKDPHIRFIVVGQHLWAYIEKYHATMLQHSVCYEPAVPSSFCRTVPLEPKKVFTLLYYLDAGAPVSLQNYGFLMLQKAVELGYINGGEWEIITAGFAGPSIEISPGVIARNVGSLRPDEYGGVLAGTDLVFTLTDLPGSGRFLKAAQCSGCVTLSNSWAGGTGPGGRHNSILSGLSTGEFLENIGKAARLAQDIPARENNWKDTCKLLRAEGTLDSILHKMGEWFAL